MNDNLLEVKAELNGSHLTVEVNGETVRSLEPNDGGVYQFKYDNEIYHFIYEENTLGNKTSKRVYFYPLNTFNEREIELNDNE